MRPYYRNNAPPASTTNSKLNHKRIRTIVLTLLFGLIAACSFKEPVLPTWNVELNVPIATEVFRIGEEIVDDSTVVVEGADSLIFISITGELEDMDLDPSEFSFDGFDITNSFEIGEIHMDSLASLETGPLALRTIFPELEQFIIDGQGTVFTMAETTIVPTAPELETSDFISMHLVGGTFELEFDNNLPFPLGPNTSNPNGIEIIIYDSNNDAVTSVSIDEVIEPGESAAASSPISSEGTWVVAPLRAEYILPVAAETTFPLDDAVLDTTGVEIVIGFANLVADEVTAVVDPQEIEKNFAVALENENQIRDAVVEIGAINLSFQNNTPLPSIVNFSIGGLFTTTNQIYEGQSVVPAFGQDVVEIDITGMRLAHPDGTTNLLDSLDIAYRVVTQATESMTHIRATDNVSVDVEVDYLAFQSFSGLIVEKVFEIDPIEQNDLANYDNFPDNLELESVDFMLNISNELFIENMAFNLFITGYHEENGSITDSATIQILNYPINSGSPGSPGLTAIGLNGQDVADFLNILPTSIRTRGDVTASGEVVISQNSQVSGDYALSTPLKLRIDGDAIIEGDEQILTEEDLDEDLQKAADENLEEAQLILQFTNHTPLSGTVQIIVSTDEEHLDIYDDTYFNPELEFIKEVVISPGPTDPLTGYVTEPAVSPIELNLTREEFQLFNDPPLRIGFRVLVDGTEDYVALRASDYIQISGLARVIVIIED